jgi:hypothetical protein
VAEQIVTPPLVEPEIVPCHFVEGVQIEVHGNVVRIVGWIRLETLETGAAPERRIVIRMAMPTATSRELLGSLRRSLTRRGH